MRDKILIFGGTTEGREFADVLSKSGVPHVVSVATEYGAEILSNSGEDNLLVGRKSAEEIAVIIREGGFNVVVDATHPFATVASKEIKAACTKENVRYMRLKRNTSAHNDSAEVVGVSSVDEAADILKQVDGNILLMTGSKDLGKLADLIGNR